MGKRIRYRGYDIVPETNHTGWGAWILLSEVPQGRVIDQPSGEEAVAAAKDIIDRRERDSQKETGHFV
jgi:hypothetical protein